MFAANLNCIPRYNWDYGIADLSRALAGTLRYFSGGMSLPETFLGQPCVHTTSGRASLFAILRALRLPQGSAVGVPLFCCPVVFATIAAAGIRPLFLDIERATYTIDPADVARKRKRMAAVVAVHMFGHQADMNAVVTAADGLPVIEDCAQGLLSTRNTVSAGYGGTAAFFSFRAGKYLSVGEGSVVVSRIPGLLDAVRSEVEAFPYWTLPQTVLHSIATYGKATFYRRPLYGVIGRPLGKRLDRRLNLTAKDGMRLRRIAPGDRWLIEHNLPKIREKIKRQRRYASYYLAAITRDDVALPFERPGYRSNYYQFALRTAGRDELAIHLAASGVDAARYLDGIDGEAHAYGYEGGCPVAEECSRTVLTIPNYYTLSPRDIAHVADAVNAFNVKRGSP